MHNRYLEPQNIKDTSGKTEEEVKLLSSQLGNIIDLATCKDYQA